MNRYLVIDSQGAARVGPFGAWWAWLIPAVDDVLGCRVSNVAAVAYAAGAIYGAARLGHLVLFLGIIAGMVAATAVAIVLIERRISADRGPYPARLLVEAAQEHKRVAAAIAARRLREAA